MDVGGQVVISAHFGWGGVGWWQCLTNDGVNVKEGVGWGGGGLHTQDLFSAVQSLQELLVEGVEIICVLVSFI